MSFRACSIRFISADANMMKCRLITWLGFITFHKYIKFLGFFFFFSFFFFPKRWKQKFPSAFFPLTPRESFLLHDSLNAPLSSFQFAGCCYRIITSGSLWPQPNKGRRCYWCIVYIISSSLMYKSKIFFPPLPIKGTFFFCYLTRRFIRCRVSPLLPFICPTCMKHLIGALKIIDFSASCKLYGCVFVMTDSLP